MFNIDSGITISFLFLFKMLLILFLIYLLAVLTPKIAKKIDSASEKKKTKPEDEHLYQVQSPFEPHPDDEKPNKTSFPELQEMKNNTTNGNEDLINGKEQ